MCSICTEKFNKSTHSQVGCQVCNVTCCSSCVERYLISSTENAHCMSCRGAWNREMLETCGLSKKFVRVTYKKHREDVLFERERGLMPATQPLVEKTIMMKKCEEAIRKLEQENLIIHSKYTEMYNTPLQDLADSILSDSMLDVSIYRLQQAFKIYEQVAINHNTITMYRSQINTINNLRLDPKKETRKFVRACPQNGCRGFLSTAWKCGVCEKWACPDCHEPKEDEHTCKPECLETARLLAKDTKTCPKCAALIFKIEGCDQMWCTQCSTAFSWRTGNIEVGRIHNPHYYDYQRQHGTLRREIGDIPCGGMPDYHSQVAPVLQRFRIDTDYLRNIIQYSHHLAAVTMNDYVPRWTDNQDIRIKLMMNELEEDKFKQKIQAREKENEKRVAIANVLNTYQVVCAEIMQRICTSTNGAEVLEILPEFDAIRTYTTDHMEKLSLRYQCVTPRIMENFSVIRLK